MKIMMKFKKSLALFALCLAALLGISGCADNQPEHPVYTKTVSQLHKHRILQLCTTDSRVWGNKQEDR